MEEVAQARLAKVAEKTRIAAEHAQLRMARASQTTRGCQSVGSSFQHGAQKFSFVSDDIPLQVPSHISPHVLSSSNLSFSQAPVPPHLQSSIFFPLVSNLPPFPYFDVHSQSRMPPMQITQTLEPTITWSWPNRTIADPSELRRLHNIEGDC